VGIELRIRGEGGQWPPEVVSPETFLERLPARACFAEVPVVAAASGAGILELRRANANPDAMPAVSVRIEERGFYVLDNDRTVANLVVAELVRYLTGSFERVTIEEP
jgi:hypothetical protein